MLPVRLPRADWAAPVAESTYDLREEDSLSDMVVLGVDIDVGFEVVKKQSDSRESNVGCHVEKAEESCGCLCLL